MFTIADIGGAAAQFDCTILGKTVPIRALSSHDTYQIIAAFPEPKPPMIHEAGRPSVPNKDHPKYAEYVSKLEARHLTISGATIAAGLSLARSVDLGLPLFDVVRDDGQHLAIWCEQANGVIRTGFTFAQLNILADGQSRASRGAYSNAAEGLWRPVPDDHIDPPGLENPPERRVETETMLKLRACERLNISPRDIELYSAGEIALFIQFDRYRAREEREAMVAGAAQ